MVDKDWSQIITKMPRTLDLIREYALKDENYEKLAVIKKHELFLKTLENDK